jgi:hypothetical protein
VINQVFLIYVDGRLVYHKTRSDWEGTDERSESPEDDEDEKEDEDEDEDGSPEPDEEPHDLPGAEEEMDSDIMAGMLTAIQNFIKEGLKKKTGTLNIVKYGDLWILIEKYADLIMALVIEGKEKEELREAMRDVLISIWDTNRNDLVTWDGNREKFSDSIAEAVDEIYKLSD